MPSSNANPKSNKPKITNITGIGGSRTGGNSIIGGTIVVPPPVGVSVLKYPSENLTATTAAKTRFLNWVTNGTSNTYGLSAFHYALAYKLNGNATLAQKAVDKVAAEVAQGKTDVGNGINPPMGGGSYLYAFDTARNFLYTLQYCRSFMSAQAIIDAEYVVRQGVYNIWNRSTNSWYGTPISSTAWAVDDPGNNYYYSFLGATTTWALYSGDQQWYDFLRNVKFPQLRAYLATLPEGGSQEGTGYGLSHANLFEVYSIWETSVGEDIHSSTTHCNRDMDYWINATSPDFAYVATLGDQARVSNGPMYDYHRKVMLLAQSLNLSTPEAARCRWWLPNYPQMQNGFNFVYDMVDSSGTSTAPTALRYDAVSAGHYFVRSSWNVNATFLNLTCGNVSQSHAQVDNGAFDLWGNGKWIVNNQNSRTHSGIQQGSHYFNMLRFENSSNAIIEQNRSIPATVQITDNGSIWTANCNMSSQYNSITWNRNLTYSRPDNLVVTDSYATPVGTTAIFQIQTPVALTQMSANVFENADVRVTINSPSAFSTTNKNWTMIDPSDNTGTYGFDGFLLEIRDTNQVGTFNVTFDVL